MGGANGTVFPPVGANPPIVLDGDRANFPGGAYSTAPYIALPPGIVGSLQDVTIELWAGQTSNTINGLLFSAGSTSKGTNPHASGSGNSTLEIGVNRGGVGKAFYNSEVGNSPLNAEYGPVMTNSAEYHLVAVYAPDSGEAKFYVNGILQTNIAVSSANRLSSLNDQVVWLGLSLNNNPGVNGWINELRIYQGEMSDADVAASYAAGPSSGLPALTVDWARSPWPAPAGSGDLLSRMGVCGGDVGHGQGVDLNALNAAQAGGFKYIRTDFNWNVVEVVPGVYNFSNYDNLCSAITSRNMKPVFILDYGNTNYCNPTNNMYPPTNSFQITAFGNFAYAAAQHFAGKGVIWEAWNEPDWDMFWLPKSDPVQYAALAKVAISQVHQADPQAVVLPTIASPEHTAFLDTALSNGGGVGANGIGVHPYDCNPPELLNTLLPPMKSIVAEHYASPPPIYITEWGFSSTDFGPNGNGADAGARQRQAVMVAREMLNSCAAGFPLYVYYAIGDWNDPTNEQANFGLIDYQYNDKPAMTAMKTLASVASGRTYVGLAAMPNTGLIAMRFDGPTNKVFAIWSSVVGSPITIGLPTYATAMDMLGSPLDISKGTNSVSESLGPIYVSIPVPAAPAGLSATVGDGSCLLTWTGSSNAASYVVMRAMASGGPYSVVITNITSLTYSDLGLTNGAAYYYVVAAVNPAGTNQSCRSHGPSGLFGAAKHSS